MARVLVEHDLLRQVEHGRVQVWTSGPLDTSAPLVNTRYGSAVSVTVPPTTAE